MANGERKWPKMKEISRIENVENSKNNRVESRHQYGVSGENIEMAKMAAAWRNQRLK
jgi:hypothetical protein